MNNELIGISTIPLSAVKLDKMIDISKTLASASYDYSLKDLSMFPVICLLYVYKNAEGDQRSTTRYLNLIDLDGYARAFNCDDKEVSLVEFIGKIIKSTEPKKLEYPCYDYNFSFCQAFVINRPPIKLIDIQKDVLFTPEHSLYIDKSKIETLTAKNEMTPSNSTFKEIKPNVLFTSIMNLDINPRAIYFQIFDILGRQESKGINVKGMTIGKNGRIVFKNGPTLLDLVTPIVRKNILDIVNKSVIQKVNCDTKLCISFNPMAQY